MNVYVMLVSLLQAILEADAIILGTALRSCTIGQCIVNASGIIVL